MFVNTHHASGDGVSVVLAKLWLRVEENINDIGER